MQQLVMLINGASPASERLTLVLCYWSDLRMLRRLSSARALVLLCVVIFLIAPDAGAQIPYAEYRTFETPHFILTFEIGLEDYASRAAVRVEAAYARLAKAYGAPPRGKIRRSE